MNNRRALLTMLAVSVAAVAVSFVPQLGVLVLRMFGLTM